MEFRKAFQAGEEWAFSKIYTRFKKPILNYVFSRVKDPQTSEDLQQEIFLKAYRFRTSYREQYALSTWLWTIARNTIADWRRKNSVNHGNPLPLEDFSQLEEEIASTAPSAESLLHQDAERKELMSLMGRLTSLQRRVIHMRVIHHLSYEEIARKLNLSLSAVKCLAYRSRQALLQLGVSPAY